MAARAATCKLSLLYLLYEVILRWNADEDDDDDDDDNYDSPI